MASWRLNMKAFRSHRQARYAHRAADANSGFEMFELIFFCRNGSGRQRCRNCPRPRPGSIKAVLVDAARSEQKGAWPL
jgi:hypothetical protein